MQKFWTQLILYFIIVRERKISGTTAARGLKFWLQVALGAPIATAWKQIRKSGSGKSGFSGNFFFAFFASMDLLGPQGHPWMFRYHLIRIRTGKSGFSKIRIFRFFDFLSLKTLQYGCLWTPLDQPKSPVPVLRYLRYFSVLFRYFCNKYTNHKLLHLEGFFLIFWILL